MKVLLLAHPEGDYLEAGVYIGLYEILGRDGIVDYPYKRSYHGEMHEYPSSYAHGDRTGHTGPFDWMPNCASREWSGDEVLTALREHRFDFMIFTPRPWALRELRWIISQLGRDALPTLVLMDGEDYVTPGTVHGGQPWSLIYEFRPHVYLKRELLPEFHHGQPCRVEPFPFCSPIPPREPVEKSIDIFFPCGATSGLRLEVVNSLRAQYGSRFLGGTDVRFGHAGYLDALARSKVAISVRGWGMDTLRYWEIPSFDTLMIADEISLVRPHPFTHGENILSFGGLNSLLDGVRRALEDEPWRARIAQAGNAHLRTFHTSRARAQQLIDHAVKG